MVKSWRNLEQLFKDAGIKYEQKDWVYLCYLEGRQFYYSPQTGKWRLKGKKAWQKSQNPQEFIKQALNYFSTNEQASQTQNHSQNHQRKNSKQTTKKTPKNPKNNSNNQSNSSSQNFNSEKANEIRPEFLEQFGQFLKIQRERGYKVSWILYSLLDQFVPTPIEICWLCVVFRYSSGWAFHQIKNLYGQANWEAILTLIEKNQSNWLQEFQTRWGTENSQKHKKEKRHHQVKEFNQHILTYQSYLKTLKISFPFTKQELKSAYRKRALETHPDSGGTAEEFREVNTAYQILLEVSS